MKTLDILLLFLLCSILLSGTANSNKLKNEIQEKEDINKKIKFETYLDNETEDDEDSDMHFENNEVDDQAEVDDDESENDYDSDDFMNHYKQYRGVEDRYITKY